jgi:hypothetical protein
MNIEFNVKPVCAPMGTTERKTVTLNFSEMLSPVRDLCEYYYSASNPAFKMLPWLLFRLRFPLVQKVVNRPPGDTH